MYLLFPLIGWALLFVWSRTHQRDLRSGAMAATVRDGMKALEAPFLLCLDSDGRGDPKDFAAFWAVRNDADVIPGLASEPPRQLDAQSHVRHVLRDLQAAL